MSQRPASDPARSTPLSLSTPPPLHASADGGGSTGGFSASTAAAASAAHDGGFVVVGGGGGGGGDPASALSAAASAFFPAPAREDFVLISEFAEHEGPIPVLTIPESMLEASTMNLSAFVLRIMAVDYQVRAGADGFLMPEDSQLFLTEPDERVFAFVYQCTLYDINARGFVRPICLSFITSDPDKVMANFEELCREFSKALAVMKEVNLSNFLQELEQRYHDLVFTRQSYAEASSTQSPQLGADDQEHGHQAVDRDNVDNYIQETTVMIKSVARKLKGVSTSTSSVTVRSTDAPNGPISRSTTEPENIHPPVYQPRILRHLHKSSRFDVPLRTIAELSSAEAHRGTLSRLNRILAHYRRPNFVLQLEAEEARAMGPVPCCLLTVGRTIVLNFAPTTALPGERFSQSDFLLSRSINLTGTLQSSRRGSLAPPPPSTARSVDTGDAASSCSYESAKETLESVSPPYEDAIEAEELFSDMVLNESSPTDYVYQDVMSRQGSRSNSFYRSPETSAAGSYQEATPFQDKDVRSVPIASTVAPPPAGVVKYMPIESFVDHVWHDSRRKAGAGIARVCRKYSFIKHLIFALLHGRPVVVVGQPENEGQVRALVVALATFVPGHSSRNQVLPWRLTPIALADLAKIRLVGCSKRVHLSRVVETYVSVLDFEAETLKTPPYQHGSYIERILGSNKFASNDAFLANLHACLLQIAREAYMLYHTCCVANPDIPILRLQGGIFNFGGSSFEGSTRDSRAPSLVTVPSSTSMSDMRSRGNTTSTVGGGGAPLAPPTESPTFTRAAAAAAPPAPAAPAVTTGAASVPATVAPADDDRAGADMGRSESQRRRSMRSALTESLRTEAARRPRVGTRNLSLTTTTLEPSAYPPVYVDRMRRWETKFNLLPHDRVILEYFIEVIKSQQIFELERIAGMHGRSTTGTDDDGTATAAAAPPTLHLDFFRSQVFKNTIRSTR